MKPALWGPALWQALFACAWHCDAASLPRLRALLLQQVPLLLPCAKCRAHFAAHKPRVDRRAKGEPRSPEHAFRWLWYLKDEVNATLGRRSVPLDDVTERHVFHGGLVDDVALGDALVLVALEAKHLGREAVFADFCASLCALLPLPCDAELTRALCDGPPASRVVTFALRAASAARVERGLRTLSLAHYKAVAED